MNETQVKFKDNITRYDLINVINMIVDLVIYKDMNGEIQYKPYDKEFALDIGVVSFLLNGVKIDGVKDIYEFIYSNEEITELLTEFKEHKIHSDNVHYIQAMSDDIIEFKKQEYIQRNDELNARLLKALDIEEKLNEASLKLTQKQSKLLDQQIRANEYQEKVAEQMSPEEFAKLNQMYISGEFDTATMVNQVVKQYIDSAIHQDKMSEVLDEKNKQIVELNKYKKMHEARNVLADGE